MNHIDYFKQHAKKLYKDYKTQSSYVDENDGHTYYTYTPKFFDIDGIFLAYDWDETKFSLMKAQHFIAMMTGFRKWDDLLKASDTELELARLVFDNEDKISPEEWEMYLDNFEYENNITLCSESKLELFKKVFAEVDGHYNTMERFRLDKQGDHPGTMTSLR